MVIPMTSAEAAMITSKLINFNAMTDFHEILH